MIELPEAAVLAAQLTAEVGGRRVTEVIAGRTPHKWAWFNGDPAAYDPLLRGRTVDAARSCGGFVDVEIGGAHVLLAEGVALRLYRHGERRPDRHQLLVTFDDGSALCASVQMYGGLWAYEAGAVDNRYYAAARAFPSPLDDAFDSAYFATLVGAPGADTLSAKGLLATEQRIPGLGNGVLQDILFEAGVHPRRKVRDLSTARVEALFAAVKSCLAEMTRLGGRDTERDLRGEPGGYRTRMSRNTVGQPCPRCGTAIARAQYLGGSVYFCGTCQD